MEIIIDILRKDEVDVIDAISPLFVLDNYYDGTTCPSMDDLYKLSTMITDLVGRNPDAMVIAHEWMCNDVGLIRHSFDVSVASTLLGIWAGVEGEELTKLCLSGLLHDIGKIYLNSTILESPRRLHSTEMNVVKQHPLLGYLFMYDYFPDLPYDIAQNILFHHERTNGSGYFSILGGSLLKETRIITIADIFSACVENRTYHESRTVQDGLDILSSEEGLDHALVKLFIENFDRVRTKLPKDLIKNNS